MPVLLPDDWAPNDQHRAECHRFGLDPDALADEFRRRMAGERRREWNKAFGAFIAAAADGRDAEAFP